eukprot:XP_025007740.1 uncharacterized protein LOC112532716 [Gallus gallus]
MEVVSRNSGYVDLKERSLSAATQSSVLISQANTSQEPEFHCSLSWSSNVCLPLPLSEVWDELLTSPFLQPKGHRCSATTGAARLAGMPEQPGASQPVRASPAQPSLPTLSAAPLLTPKPACQHSTWKPKNSSKRLERGLRNVHPAFS